MGRVGKLLILAAAFIFIWGCDNLVEPLEDQILKSQGVSSYDIRLVAGDGGNVNFDRKTVLDGQTIDIVATPDNDRLFVSWEKISGTGIVDFHDSTQAETSVTLTEGSVSIRANFSDPIPVRTLRLSAGAGGIVSLSEIEVLEGQLYEITATPDAGFTFLQWIKVSSGLGIADIVNTAQATTSVALYNGNVSLEARFTSRPLRSLELDSTQGGSVEQPTTSPAIVGDSEPYSIIAAEPDYGWDFTGWIQTGGPGTASFTDSMSLSTDVTISGGDASIQAVYERETYNLTVSVDTDSTETILVPLTGSASVTFGIPFAIEASAPSSGDYEFVGWQKKSGNGDVTFTDSTSSSTTVIIEGGDAVISAKFQRIPRTVTFLTGDDYSSDNSIIEAGSFNQTSMIIGQGASTSISVTPHESYSFDNWSKVSGTGSVTFGDSTSPSTTITISGGDVEIRANFSKKTYILTLSADSGESTTPTGAQTVYHGVPFSIASSTPDGGSFFYQWEKTAGLGSAHFEESTNRETQVSITGGDVTILADYESISASLKNISNYTYLNTLYTSIEIFNGDLWAGGLYGPPLGKSSGVYCIYDISLLNPSSLTKGSNISTGTGTAVTDFYADDDNIAIAYSGLNGGVRDIVLNGATTDYPISGGVSMVTGGGFANPFDSLNLSLFKTVGPISLALTPLHSSAEILDVFYHEAASRVLGSYQIDSTSFGFGQYQPKVLGKGIESIGTPGISTTAIFDMESYDSYLYLAADSRLSTTHYSTKGINPGYQIGTHVNATANTGNFRMLRRGGTSGEYLFCFGDTNRISVFDIHIENEARGEPVYVTSIATQSGSSVMDMACYRNYLYTVENGRIYIYRLDTNYP